DNAGLQPTHVVVGLAPVDGMPRPFFVGNRTSSLLVCRHLLCLLCRFFKRSCHERPRGSLPAFPWSDVTTPICPITEPLSLFPPSCTRTSIGFPCGSLSPSGERYGLIVFRFTA